MEVEGCQKALLVPSCTCSMILSLGLLLKASLNKTMKTAPSVPKAVNHSGVRKAAKSKRAATCAISGKSSEIGELSCDRAGPVPIEQQAIFGQTGYPRTIHSNSSRYPLHGRRGGATNRKMTKP